MNPPDLRNALYVFRLDLPELRHNRSFLSREEQAAASRFQFAPDAERWSVGRGTLRAILGHHLAEAPDHLPIHGTPSGKPCFPPQWLGPDFNLSHSGDLALVGISHDGPVGVDLEPLARAPELLGCEGPFLHPSEIESLSSHPRTRSLQLLSIWTAKEAFLKALGTGFLQNPTEIRIDFTLRQAIADLPVPGLDRLRLHRLESPLLDGYLAAVALPAPVPLPDVRAWPLGL